MAGQIYCFNCVGDHRIYKAGHTQQKLSSRLKSYLGPSKVRTLVAQRQVDDSVAAETFMLGLLRQCYALRLRRDLGNEWFQLREDVDVHVCQAAIVFIFEVVSKAVRNMEDTQPVECPNVPETTLPAMGIYFEALDRFVDTASHDELSDTDHALRVFEESDKCPVIVEFLPWPRNTRLKITQNRYPHVFGE